MMHTKTNDCNYRWLKNVRNILHFITPLLPSLIFNNLHIKNINVYKIIFKNGLLTFLYYPQTWENSLPQNNLLVSIFAFFTKYFSIVTFCDVKITVDRGISCRLRYILFPPISPRLWVINKISTLYQKYWIIKEFTICIAAHWKKHQSTLYSDLIQINGLVYLFKKCFKPK